MWRMRIRLDAFLFVIIFFPMICAHTLIQNGWSTEFEKGDTLRLCFTKSADILYPKKLSETATSFSPLDVLEYWPKEIRLSDVQFGSAAETVNFNEILDYMSDSYAIMSADIDSDGFQDFLIYSIIIQGSGSGYFFSQALWLLCSNDDAQVQICAFVQLSENTTVVTFNPIIRNGRVQSFSRRKNFEHGHIYGDLAVLPLDAAGSTIAPVQNSTVDQMARIVPHAFPGLIISMCRRTGVNKTRP